MKTISKKIIALVAVTTMVVTLFVGCGGVDNNAVVATVGDDKITAGFVTFYTRYQQSLMQEDTYVSYYGEDFWELELMEEGKTYEESVKDSILESIQDMHILEDHAKEYKLSLSEEELAEINKAAEAFDKANAAEVKESVAADKGMVVAYLRLRAIAYKVGEAMVADVDTNVSDEEAAQKKLCYVLYSTKVTSDDGTVIDMSEGEIKAAKTLADNTLSKAKENGSLQTHAQNSSLEPKTVTFDAESTELPEEVIKAANALKAKEFAEVIKTDDGYYVVQLESEFDREATDAEKENIVTQRKNDKYDELLKKWTKDTKIEVDEKAYAKISLKKMKVNQKAKETEKKED